MATTDEEKAKLEAAETAKAKKADSFIDKVADRVVAKQAATKKADVPPKRDVKQDEILESTVSGDQELDEFMFGESPAPKVPDVTTA